MTKSIAASKLSLLRRWFCIAACTFLFIGPAYGSVAANCGAFPLLTSYTTHQNWPYDGVRLQIPWYPLCGGMTGICAPLPAFMGANVRQAGAVISVDIFASDTALPSDVLNLAAPATPQLLSVDAGPLSPGTYTVQGTVYGITNGVKSDVCNGPMTLTSLAIEQATAPVARQTAVEFYNGARDHYFMSSDIAEIAALDAGTTPGWSRTGRSFAVFAAGKAGGVGIPVCRFYGSPDAGLDSHFYTANAEECAALPGKFGGAWKLETTNAFEVRAPDAKAACPAGFIPIYRLWNRRADSNHRFTTEIAVVLEMQNKGWTVESAVGAGASMCSPP